MQRHPLVQRRPQADLDLQGAGHDLLGQRAGPDVIAVGGYFRPGQEAKLVRLVSTVTEAANALGSETWLCPLGYGFKERCIAPTPFDAEAAFHRFGFALAAARGMKLYGPRMGLGLYSDRLKVPKDLGRSKPTELRKTLMELIGGKGDGVR